MFRPLLIVFLAVFFMGCSSHPEKLVGEPVYFKHIKDDMFWENLVIYGKLQKNTLRKPTAVYYSAFGHGYCMSEEVTFEAQAYIKGTGPDTVTFQQNIIDHCQPIAQSIGFGEAVLFLSKNEHRGIWSTGSASIRNIEGESRIFKPIDIMRFLSFDNFESLLTEYKEPFEWIVELGQQSEKDLEILKNKGVLSYRKHPKDKSSRVYVLNMYKYISVEALLSSNN